MTQLATPYRSGLISAAYANKIAKIGYSHISTNTSDLGYVDNITEYELQLYKHEQVVHGSLLLEASFNVPGSNPLQIANIPSEFLPSGSDISVFSFITNYNANADELFECHATSSILRFYRANASNFADNASIAIGNFIGPLSFSYVIPK